MALMHVKFHQTGLGIAIVIALNQLSNQLSELQCPLYNFKTVKDIFKKLGMNIDHHQTMCREQEQ